MISFQKSYQVLFISLWFYLVHSVHIGSILSALILFIPHWSYLVYSANFGPLQLYLGHLVHFSPFCPLWFYSIHIELIQYILSPSKKKKKSTFYPLRSYLIDIGPIRSYSVHYIHFSPILSIHSYLLLFSWSNLVQLCPLWSTLIHYVLVGFVLSIRYTSFQLVQFGSIMSTSVQFNSFQSTSVHFCTLTYKEKKTCLV